MTERQAEVLQFIRAYIAKHEFSPTFDEIGAAIGRSKSNVCLLIGKLARQGYVAREYRSRRSIRLLKQAA